jgi:hypothetical protein
VRQLSQRTLLCGALAAPVVAALAAAGAATVSAAIPDASSPEPSTGTTVNTIALGDLARPAPVARRLAALPADLPLSDEAGSAKRARSARVTLNSTQAFSAIGVSWADDPSVGSVTIAVRTLAPGRTGWSGWQTAGDEPDERAAPTGTVRGGSGVVWTAPSTGADVVVTSLTGSAPRDLKLDLIDPKVLPGDSALADRPEQRRAGRLVAKRRVGAPPINSRRAWGADEKKMTWDPEYAPVLVAAVLHHTATTNSYRPQDVPGILRSIYQFQAVSRGWGDVGYNVLVDRFGRAWEGRYGGIGRAVIGAHAGGFNSGTTGVAMIGNFTSVRPTSAQLETVARYLAWKFAWAGIWAPGRTWIRGGPSTKYKTNQVIGVNRLYPHQRTSLTACPGKFGVAAIPWLVRRADALIAHAPVYIPPRPVPSPSPPPTPLPEPSPTT